MHVIDQGLKQGGQQEMRVGQILYVEDRDREIMGTNEISRTQRRTEGCRDGPKIEGDNINKKRTFFIKSGILQTKEKVLTQFTET